MWGAMEALLYEEACESVRQDWAEGCEAGRAVPVTILGCGKLQAMWDVKATCNLVLNPGMDLWQAQITVCASWPLAM